MAQALIDEKEGRRRSLPSLRRQPKPDYFSIQRGAPLEIEEDDVQEVQPSPPPPAQKRSRGRPSQQKLRDRQQGEAIAFVDLTCDEPTSSAQQSFSSKAGRARGPNYGLRRRSGPIGGSVELMMECDEDVLSQSQIEATKKAREEYRKALKMIEQAKLGNMAAVMSSQSAPSPVTAKTAGPNGSSDDIIIVGETPPPIAPARPVQKPVSIPVKHTRPPAPTMVPARPPAIAPQPVPVLPPPPAPGAAVPQQVYRFVNYGQGAAGSPANPQWVLRPLMQVMPQQQVQRAPVPSAASPPGMPTIVSGTSGLGIKRAPDSPDFPVISPPPKKSRGRASSETDSSGNWVPLDEYYYGKMEGDPTYHEEKAEFRFKCWMCTKMLYNNVKAMMHLQGHIDSEKQQNLDLSDLTQCKHCYKQFDTPFEMQTHIEKVHMNNVNVLMCRICEKDHDSRSALTTHMRQNHCACEMPYVCQLCNFRSSMYSDVVDHFKKKHDASSNLLCLYCLRVFHIKFVSQGWGQTQTYYHHLLRHQSKTNNRKCTFCKLSFFNPQDLKTHRKTNHQPNQKGVIGANAKYSTPDQVMIKVPEAGIQPKKSAGPKSLNAPTVTKVKEHRGLHFPSQAASHYCFECKMLMSTADHYKKYIQCSMCRFATSCSFAYASHMMGFHSGQVSSLSTSVPWERSMPAPLYCLCGFSSKYGNKIANHLVFCSKRTCYLVKPEASLMEKPGQDEQGDPRRKPGASILDVLGLVKKQSLVSARRWTYCPAPEIVLSSEDEESGTGAAEDAEAGPGAAEDAELEEEEERADPEEQQRTTDSEDKEPAPSTSSHDLSAAEADSPRDTGATQPSAGEDQREETPPQSLQAEVEAGSRSSSIEEGDVGESDKPECMDVGQGVSADEPQNVQSELPEIVTATVDQAEESDNMEVSSERQDTDNVPHASEEPQEWLQDSDNGHQDDVQTEETAEEESVEQEVPVDSSDRVESTVREESLLEESMEVEQGSDGKDQDESVDTVADVTAQEGDTERQPEEAVTGEVARDGMDEEPSTERLASDETAEVMEESSPVAQAETEPEEDQKENSENQMDSTVSESADRTSNNSADNSQEETGEGERKAEDASDVHAADSSCQSPTGGAEDEAAAGAGKQRLEPPARPASAGDFGESGVGPAGGQPEEEPESKGDHHQTGQPEEEPEAGGKGDHLINKVEEIPETGLTGEHETDEKEQSRTGAGEVAQPGTVQGPEKTRGTDAPDSGRAEKPAAAPVTNSDSRQPHADNRNSYSRDEGRGGQNREESRSGNDSRDRDKYHSDSRDRSHDRWRDHSGSYYDRDHSRDYRRDRDRYDRDYDRNWRHDRYHDQRYDSQRGRYPPHQGGYQSRDRYYDQNRQGNRGGQNRYGYQDRSYHRGYY